VRRGWSIVDRNQDRISHLVMDMLTFSKDREPERIESDLNETVADVVELMQTRAADMDVKLSCDLDTSLPIAAFDPDGIHRAVLNLVTNAIDAAAGTSDDDQDFEADEITGSSADRVGKVFVRTRFDPTVGWIVEVLDNGPGVSPEDREKIFSLFESRKGMRGTGLGLPVSAKIMREHGGDIQVTDPDHGRGTCFRLRLPASGTNLSDLSHRDTMS
jgi:signal transduction histidine kinase